jgi:hypothetical protein
VERAGLPGPPPRAGSRVMRLSRRRARCPGLRTSRAGRGDHPLRSIHLHDRVLQRLGRAPNQDRSAPRGIARSPGRPQPSKVARRGSRAGDRPDHRARIDRLREAHGELAHAARIGDRPLRGRCGSPTGQGAPALHVPLGQPCPSRLAGAGSTTGGGPARPRRRASSSWWAGGKAALARGPIHARGAPGRAIIRAARQHDAHIVAPQTGLS